MCLCVCRAANARPISLGGEGNALYPVLSSLGLCLGAKIFAIIITAVTDDH